MRPQAAAMKALLDQRGLQIMPGCGDEMGARLIEEAGFLTGFVSGSSIAAMRLAMLDMDLLTFPEMADAARRIPEEHPPTEWARLAITAYGAAGDQPRRRRDTRLLEGAGAQGPQRAARRYDRGASRSRDPFCRPTRPIAARRDRGAD